MDEENKETVNETNETTEEPKEEKLEQIQIEGKKEFPKEDLEENTSIDDDGKNSANGSEYESVDSGANSSEDEEDKMCMGHSENEDINSVDSESENSEILEREEGDGQESLPAKKIDDDEDKKNPQYIPKRGTFYEHDDRTADESPDKKEPEKNEKQSKKNVWMEKKERWGHDRYNDNEQAPKSRAELVAIYGYDIRNEDGPPRARRRRRYGRGPNKYTRTWEDEEAYKPAKPVRTVARRPRNRSSEYSKRQENRSDDGETEQLRSPTSSDSAQMQFPTENSSNHAQLNDPPTTSPTTIQENSNMKPYLEAAANRTQQQRVGTGRIVKPKPEIKKEIKDSDYKGFTRTRQFRNSKSEQKILPKFIKKDKNDVVNNKQNDMQDLEKNLNKLNVQDGIAKGSGKQSNSRQNSVPPRLQAEQKGSKRYSSLRQRSLPESTAPTFNQGATYYGNDYNRQAPSTQQGLLPQPNSINAHVPQIAPPPLPPLPQQVPVTATSILQAPPQFPSPFTQPPPPFLQANPPPPPFLPQPAPQIINYVQGQPQYPQPPPPPYQGYQHQQFNSVNQPAELYQCQGGTTYYSTQNQHLGQRSAPTKRPKAAIPIVPPPPQEPRGRGRTSNQRDTPPTSDEIDEIIYNEKEYEDADAALAVQQ